MQKTLYQKKHNNMKKLVIIMLVLLTMTQNSTAQTAGGETKIFPMFGLTLSKTLIPQHYYKIFFLST